LATEEQDGLISSVDKFKLNRVIYDLDDVTEVPYDLHVHRNLQVDENTTINGSLAAYDLVNTEVKWEHGAVDGYGDIYSSESHQFHETQFCVDIVYEASSFAGDQVPVRITGISEGKRDNDVVNKAQLDAVIETKTPLVVTLTVEINEDTGEPMYKASHNGIEITAHAYNNGPVILDCYGLAEYTPIPGYVALSVIEEEIPFFNV
jgi:hypothetical protein